MNASRYQDVSESIARWALVGIFLLFPIKTSASNVLLALMLLAWVLAGQYRKRWTDIRRHPITLPALAMYGLVVLGITYSPADFSQIANHLNKYSKFLIMLICLSLLTEAVWRERCRKAFMYAMTFVVLSTYANVWVQLPWSVTQTPGWGADHTVVKDYIFQGICTVLFVLMAWSEALSAPQRLAKYFWSGASVLAGLSCVYLLSGRTGMLALGMALVVYVLTLIRGRSKWVAAMGVIVLFILAVTLPGTAKTRLDQALQEVQQYQQLTQPGAIATESTSIGARLMMWELSLQEISKRPLFGAGTASYHQLAEDRLQDAAACAVACVHPHNQFLFFGVEYGLVGMLIFGFYFVSAGRHAARLSPLLKATTLGFLAIFLADSLVHGSMWLSGEQHLFSYMLALWMSYPASQVPSDQSSSTRLAG
jgi:O-antigen ligase